MARRFCDQRLNLSAERAGAWAIIQC